MNPLGEIEARVRRLEDIEAIKKLKAKYWRCVDRKLWDEMNEVFTEEATADYGPNIKLKGRQAIVQFLKSSLGGGYGDHVPCGTEAGDRADQRIDGHRHVVVE